MPSLDKILVLNLDRRPDKFFAWIGAARVSQVPPDVVERFSGLDGLKFESVHDMMAIAVEEFPFMSDLAHDKDWLENHTGRGSLGCLLSCMQALKYISERPEPDSLTIFIMDHYYLRKDWHYICSQIQGFPQFDIFQMWSWPGDNYPRPAHFPKPLEVDSTVSYGLGGAGDTCLMLSPAGAARILEWWSETPYHLLEIVLHERSQTLQERCISAIDRYEWAGGYISLEIYGLAIDSERRMLDRSERLC